MNYRMLMIIREGWLWATPHVCSWYGHDSLIPSPRQDQSFREFQISIMYLISSWFRYNYQQDQSINK